MTLSFVPRSAAVEGVGYGHVAMALLGLMTEGPQPPKPVARFAPARPAGGYYGGSSGGGGFPVEVPIFTGQKTKSPDETSSPSFIDVLNEWSSARQPAGERAVGYGSVEDVLAVAAESASNGRLEPSVRNWAVTELVKAGSPDDTGARIAVLFEAVKASMINIPNPVGAQWISGADVMTSPWLSGHVVGGSCVDYAIKLAASLMSIGIRAALVGQATGGYGRHYDHVVVAAWDGGKWVRLDASYKGSFPGYSRRSYGEVWIHLPEQVVAHQGQPPTAIPPPPDPDQSLFPVVGVGRLHGNIASETSRTIGAVSEPSRNDGLALLAVVAAVGALALAIGISVSSMSGKQR